MSRNKSSQTIHPRNAEPGPKIAPEAYYDKGSFRYWVRDSKQGFLPVDKDSLKLRLKAAGFSDDTSKFSLLSEVEDLILKIQNECGVDFAGKLAGWPVGYFPNIYHKRLLVTSATELVQPSTIVTNGEDNLIVDFIWKMLGPEQATYFLAWLKTSLNARRDVLRRLSEGREPNFQGGVACAIIGKANHGKTLLSSIVVRILCGVGAVKANPTQYSQGDTSFNKDLMESEVHVMDDESIRDDRKKREHFRAEIKKAVADPMVRIHGKGSNALMFELYRRILILLNDKPSDVRVLPPMGDGFNDKIQLLRTIAPGIIDTDWETCKERMYKAIPDFIQILDGWEIPDGIENKRLGINPFHNQSILDELEELDSESDLIETLEYLAVELENERTDAGLPNEWSSGELFNYLMNNHERRIAPIARSPIHFGRLLSEASERFPDNVILVQRHTGRTKAQYRLDFSK